MAPEGTYPADISGILKQLQEMWREGTQYAQYDARRIELGKDIFRTNVQEKYLVGTLGFTGKDRGLHIRRNNFRNVPKNSKYPAGETFYFEDGIDNVNHPGNRSKKYKSISFIDPEYWD